MKELPQWYPEFEQRIADMLVADTQEKAIAATRMFATFIYEISRVQPEVIVQLADVTDKEIEKYIDRYIDMGCFRNPEIARPYLLDGFQLGCKYMESKLSKLPE